MLYDIAIAVEYEYDNLVESGRHVVRLLPADLPGEQRHVAGSLQVSPIPEEREERLDFFGNRTVAVALREPHRKVGFRVKSRVERIDLGTSLDMSPPLSALAAEIGAARSVDGRSPHHFLGPSPRVEIPELIVDYARAATTDGASVREKVFTLGAALHADMTYDPEATTVDTTVPEAFSLRRGVCQDYAHLMIASLRSLGIPSGYVSGLLRTDPPAGRPRLEGADAMHAWVSAWCGVDTGWIEYDPTNAVVVGMDHVVVARGRDYADVAPVRGVMRTHGAHRSRQSVDVTQVVRAT